MFFDFDALEEELDSADFRRAEASSPVITDGPEASRPVEDAAPHLSQGMFKEMSDQHYRKMQELKEQRQLEDDPNTWSGNEPRIACWYMLDDTPVSGGIPESGDETRHEEASHTPTLAPTTVMLEDTGFDSEITLCDSDESGASIFGLRRTVHEVEKGDELSDSSSQDSGKMALVAKRRVQRWRKENTLLDDHDFAQVFVDFDEAYYNAGRAVAASWSKAKIREEPDIVTDSAKLSAVEATATKVRKIDRRKRKPSDKKKRATQPASLRQPGDEADAEVNSTDGARFIEPLVQLMKTLETYPIDPAATDEETSAILRRRAEQIIHEASIPTLHKVITTAAELKKYHEGLWYTASTLGPSEIENFLQLSRAPTRATEAIRWMGDHLQLNLDDWKLDDLEPPPPEIQHTPAAEPFMLRAIEEAVQRGAESNDPTWLASLATLLQANSGLRSSLILRSSVPVEQYEKWMLFFCKQGKQKHDRTGFYWGVPSVTSNGYNWSGKFLSAYNKRRHSKDGKEMMGMIFRTDTYKFLSAKVVANLAVEAVSGVGKDPGQLRPGSWAKTLPTIAAYLNLSHTERLSLGLSHDAGEGGDEESITSRYAEANKGLSRQCKTMCAAAFTILAQWDVQTFSSPTHNDWEELARSARLEAWSESLDANATWRNPDITKSRGGFKIKKSQMTFPKQLAGLPLP